MKWTIIVLTLLIIDLTSGSGFNSNGYLNPGFRSRVVLGEKIWENFQVSLGIGTKHSEYPGLDLSADKTEKNDSSVSGINSDLNENELRERMNETTSHPNDKSTQSTTSTISNASSASDLTSIPRVNGTLPINAAPDVPDKNFIDWVLNPFTTTTPVPPPIAPEDCPKCQCGMSSPPNRIVGGVEARIAKYPWVTYLTYNGKFYCAASIISDRYLLTAAHCVDRFNKKQMRAVIGAHNRNKTSETQTITYKVVDVIKHSGYSTVNYNNDIAVIKIDGKIKFEGPIRPVCLADRGPTYAGRDGIVTGWGAIAESGITSDTLQEVVVPIMTNAACRATKYPARKITENMMCAGYSEGGKDSCQGDSGGPLHVLDDKTYKVVGIVSWGEGCAAPGYPGVYSRVNRYITWIELKTKDSCYCSKRN